MDKPDFFEFLEYHNSRFRGVKVWVGESRETTEAWYQVLRHLSLEEARTASQMMFEREDLQPRGYHGQPAILRRLGLSVRAPVTSPVSEDRSSPRYYCKDCEDTGGFHVWSDGAFEYVTAHGELPSDLRYNSGLSRPVRCTCNANACLSPKIPIFARGMVRWRPADVEPLIESVAAGQRRWFSETLPQRADVDKTLLRRPPSMFDNNGRYIHPDRTISFSTQPEGSD